VAPESWDQSDGKWSPDGRQFAFISNHDGTHELRLVTTSGSGAWGPARVLVAPGLGMAADPEAKFKIFVVYYKSL
jgi:hypothetical protein